MYRYRPKDFILFRQPEVFVNGSVLSLNDLSPYSCYMDNLYPLFSTKESVRELVAKGLNSNKSQQSSDEIKELFHIDSERFERPLSGVGNEVFKAMSAIGYCYGKQLFCFPWLSKNRFNNYHNHITDLLDILESLQKIIILPLGK